MSTEGKVFKIQLDRPDKFNAITWDMYEGLIEALNNASKDRSTSLTVITGSGDYYCSGNDLSNFTRIKSPEDMIPLAEKGEKVLERFVRSLIVHEKPLVALVNGPAIGISVTVLALCDLVIASDKATFQTPFTTLGQSPEGCSSFTFPALMGTSKASEVLLFGKKLTAEEALDRNLVAQVIPHAQFHEEAERKVASMSELPPESLRLNKSLVESVIRKSCLLLILQNVLF
uniref:Enoyl-CoA delta isomerase 2, mitochondrial n=1 Tax=Ditylenchus dipsaci TaxID=166011 RepID=A0A915CZR7_9BILA